MKTKEKVKMRIYTVRLPESVIEQLRIKADEQNVTQQCFVINVLKADLEKPEDE